MGVPLGETIQFFMVVIQVSSRGSEEKYYKIKEDEQGVIDVLSELQDNQSIRKILLITEDGQSHEYTIVFRNGRLNLVLSADSNTQDTKKENNRVDKGEMFR